MCGSNPEIDELAQHRPKDMAQFIDAEILRDLRDVAGGDGGFKPYVYRSDDGAVTAYFKNVPDYSQQLTKDIRLYRSIDNDEVVGVRIEKS